MPRARPTSGSTVPLESVEGMETHASHGGGAWDGGAIRAARERAGISVEEMASRTKINTAIIRALEDERFDDAPKARVYVRGFIRCVAEEIGLDPEAVSRSFVPRWERWYERAGEGVSY